MSTVDDEFRKQIATSMNYTPKSFFSHEYETLKALCEAIIPADVASGGAIEAGVPEFIDFTASENSDYQLQLVAGLNWLDDTCVERYGEWFLACALRNSRKFST